MMKMTEICIQVWLMSNSIHDKNNFLFLIKNELKFEFILNVKLNKLF